MLSRAQIVELTSTPLKKRPNRVKYARDLLDLSQVQISEALGIPQKEVSDMENGQYSRLPLEKARMMANFFGVLIEELFPAREEMSA
jgi:transcriptional regulator with XRE-family HTH domain